MVLLLSARPRAPRAFCPRPSRVSAATLDGARLLLGLRPHLLCGRLLPHLLLPSLRGLLLPHLGATRLQVGTLLARS